MTPNQRSLNHLRDMGYEADIVEQWNSFARKRKDLFGVIDIVVATWEALIGVQATTTSNMSARRKKIIASPKALAWLASGGRLEVHGWAKRGPRGGKKEWALTVDEIAVKDFI